MSDDNKNGDSVERSIIGALLLNPANLDFCLERGLAPESFTNYSLQLVFRRMMESSGRDFDILTLSDQDSLLACLLIDISGEVVSGANLDSWVRLVRQREAQRMLDGACKNAIAEIKKNSDTGIVLQQLDIAALQIQEILKEHKTQTLTDLTREAVKELKENAMESIPWFEPGTEGRRKVRHFRRRMFVLAGESGTGKTEFSLSCVVKPCLEAGKRILYVCTESPAHEIFGRLAGCICGCHYDFITSAEVQEYHIEQWTREMHRLRKEYAKTLFIAGSDSNVNTVNAIRGQVRKHIMCYGPLDLLVVDFLQDLKSDNPKDDEYTRIGKTVNGLKDILDEFNLAGLVNAQLNRTDSRTSERPNKYRLKGSGEIEHKAHVIAFLYRDRKQKKNLFFSDKTRGVKPFEMELDFSRYGYRSREHIYSPEDCPGNNGGTYEG